MSVRRNGGLSLTELILAIGILAVLLLTTIGIFSQVLISTTKAADLTAGIYFAEKRLDQVLHNSTFNVYATEQAQNNSYTTDSANKTTFFSVVTSTPHDSEVPPRLYQVTVDVWWWSTQAAGPNVSRSGYGKLNVRLSRLYYLPR